MEVGDNGKAQVGRLYPLLPTGRLTRATVQMVGECPPCIKKREECTRVNWGTSKGAIGRLLIPGIAKRRR